jgi:flagellar protein FliS
MVNNAAEEYRRQQVLNAPPEQLTLMLYNGCLKFIDEGIEAIDAKKYEEANNSLQKAQRIISEFRLTLNMEYDISHQLLPLYNYVYDRLVEGNMKSDTSKVVEAKEIISELRDAWAEAMKKARIEKGKAKKGVK